MIDPKLLTKENGFEDGVVVEINWGEAREWFSWDSNDDPSGWATEAMVSIHPLTGPMSIWNHIPTSIAAIVRDALDYPTNLFFYANPCITGGDKTYEGKSIEYRPFWAKEKE